MAVEERALIAETFHIACISQKGELARIDAAAGTGEKPRDSKSNIDSILEDGEDSTN